MGGGALFFSKRFESVSAVFQKRSGPKLNAAVFLYWSVDASVLPRRCRNTRDVRLLRRNFDRFNRINEKTRPFNVLVVAVTRGGLLVIYVWHRTRPVDEYINVQSEVFRNNSAGINDGLVVHTSVLQKKKNTRTTADTTQRLRGRLIRSCALRGTSRAVLFVVGQAISRGFA